MRRRSISHTPLDIFILFLCVFATSVWGADFTVIPLQNTSDIAVYEVTGNYDAGVIYDANNAIPRQEITKEFYKNHSDYYDFLVIFSNFDFQMPQEAKGVKSAVDL